MTGLEMLAEEFGPGFHRHATPEGAPAATVVCECGFAEILVGSLVGEAEVGGWTCPRCGPEHHLIPRCQATTVKGTRCRFEATEEVLFCSIHAPGWTGP
jgi:hypothetical protein